MIAKGMAGLLSKLRALGKHITIETAGTAPPEGIACDLASLSPKLANSTPDAAADPAWAEKHERARLQPEVLRAWCENYDFQLKFVIASPADVAEAEAVIRRIGIAIPPEKILLMPEGTDRETLAARTEMLIPVCKARGCRLSPRLHIEWFGNQRGT